MGLSTKVALGVGWGALSFATAVVAQGAVFPGGETVVTAARIPQRLSEALRSVTVVTAEDIARSGQLTLAQVLQQLGGVEMVSNGGHGNSQAVFIRGAGSNHTLVLVDGIRLGSATAGSTAFENIPLSQIERIEIVPGPVSSSYGSDAIGGVIQIFTKSRRHSPPADFTASLGSYDTKSLKGTFGKSFGDTDLTLSASVFDTDNFDVTKPTISFGRHNPDEDGYRNRSLSGNVAHRIGDGHEVGANAMVSKGEAHFDNGPDTDDVTEQTLSVYSLYSRNQFTPGWESLLRLGRSGDDSASLGGAQEAEFTTHQTQATWQNTFRLGGGSLVAGAEYLEQEIDTTNAFEVTERTIRSVFAGYTVDIGRHGLQASVRHDDNSQFGTPTTGSVSYGLRITPSLRLRGSWGTAFHAPSFNDLYFPGFGNPALTPERSRNREVGVDFDAGPQRFSLTAFDNRITDLIVFVFDPATSSLAPQNLEKARIRGLELSYSGRILGTRLRAKATLQEPEQSNGLLLQRRARRHGSIVASRGFGPWRIDAEAVASSARFDSSDESAASRMGGYAVYNLAVARDITPEWSVQLRWNNVTDKDYELIQGYNTAGSNVLASLRWTPVR